MKIVLGNRTELQHPSVPNSHNSLSLQVASPLDSAIFKSLYSKNEIEMDDLLTPCAGTPRSIAFTTHESGNQLSQLVILYFAGSW